MTGTVWMKADAAAGVARVTGGGSHPGVAGPSERPRYPQIRRHTGHTGHTG